MSPQQKGALHSAVGCTALGSLPVGSEGSSNQVGLPTVAICAYMSEVPDTSICWVADNVEKNCFFLLLSRGQRIVSVLSVDTHTAGVKFGSPLR